MISSLAILLCLLSLQQKTAALKVTPGSTCAAVCLDDSNGDPSGSSTNSTDIVCDDQEYSTTANGIRFKNCVECLQESHAMTDEENDIFWYLYNLRYSVDVCLYGFPNATKTISSPCDIDYACRPLKNALEIGNLNPNNGSQLDYCTANSGAFTGSHLQDCIQCFRSSPNQFYISNFLTALKAGCEQKPQPGNLIGLSGSLFTQFEVNITATPQNQTDTSNDTSDTTMTTGAIVGIVVGAVLLFLGGTGLFWVYHRKQKYLYGDTLGSEGGRKSITPPPPPPGGGYPHYYEARNDPLPADWEMRAQGSFNNNAEYYDRLEKAVQSGQRPNYPFNPHALPTHPAYLPRVSSRTGSRTDTPSPPPQIRTYRPEPPQPKQTLAPAPIITTAAMTSNRLHPQPAQAQAPQLVPPPPVTLPLRDASLNHTQATTTILSAAAPPPPPPPPAQRAPRLSMPTKARKPTKYIPPRIIVDRPADDYPHQHHHSPPHSNSDSEDEADDADEVLSIGLEIQRPTPRLGPDVPRWEQESYAGYGVRTGTPPQPRALQYTHQLQQHQQQAQVVEQHAVDRRRRMTEFTDLGGSPVRTAHTYG